MPKIWIMHIHLLNVLDQSIKVNVKWLIHVMMKAILLNTYYSFDIVLEIKLPVDVPIARHGVVLALIPLGWRDRRLDELG